MGGHSNEWASQVSINYSYASYAYWQFDETTQRYLRFQGNVDLLNGQEPVYEQLTDAYTGLPIVADNLVVLYVTHEYYYKSTDSEIFDIQLEGEGNAYLFRNGRGYPARWVRSQKNKPFALTTIAGAPIALKPGITFFQVMSSDTVLNRDGQNWEFNFRRPEQ